MPVDDGSAAQIVGRLASRIGTYVTRYDNAREPRAVFAYTYLRLTRSLEHALAVGQPSFRDPFWVADLASSLASEYFAAMDEIDNSIPAKASDRNSDGEAGELPDVIPRPWRDVYAASAGGHSYVLEDVLFAMMAHISYDLPIALRRMSARLDVQAHIADYHLMNDVLGSAIDEIQDDLASRYCRGLADLDRLFTRQDELFTNYGIRVARGMAWFNFERLSDPLAAAAAERSIQASAGAFIAQVRAPDDWKLRIALQAARILIPARRQWPAPDTGHRA